VNDEKICQALVGMWAKAGLKVRLNSIPFANFIPKILNFDSSAYLLGWGVATFDAQYTLQSLVRTKTTGADGNFNQGRISDVKLDTTIDAIKIATDPKARDALLREGLITTRDQHYYVPIHHQLRPWAMKKSVTTVHRADDRPESRYARVDGGV
jgi:peptide/nickel transport system substrate-binding protein